MSFVGLNSIIYSIETDKEGTKINDVVEIKNYLKRCDISLSVLKAVNKMDETTYPFTCWSYLHGFSNYDDNEYFLFERVGYEYSKDDFIDFWKNISKYCEPFYFYHSPDDSCKPKTVFDVAQNKGIYFYKVVCVNGKVEMYKLEVSIKHGHGI